MSERDTTDEPQDGANPESVVQRLQEGHAVASEVDARMRVEMMVRLLNNPKQAAVGLGVRALTGGNSDD